VRTWHWHNEVNHLPSWSVGSQLTLVVHHNQFPDMMLGLMTSCIANWRRKTKTKLQEFMKQFLLLKKVNPIASSAHCLWVAAAAIIIYSPLQVDCFLNISYTACCTSRCHLSMYCHTFGCKGRWWQKAQCHTNLGQWCQRAFSHWFISYFWPCCHKLTSWQCTKKLSPYNFGISCLLTLHWFLALLVDYFLKFLAHNDASSHHTATHSGYRYIMAKGAIPLTLIYFLFLAMQKVTTIHYWKPLASSPHVDFLALQINDWCHLLMHFHNSGCQVCDGTRHNPHDGGTMMPIYFFTLIYYIFMALLPQTALNDDAQKSCCHTTVEKSSHVLTLYWFFSSTGWLSSKNSSQMIMLPVTMSPHILDVSCMVEKGTMQLYFWPCKS